MPNDGDIINAKRAATQVPDYQPTGPEFDYYKAPEHGYHDLMYDTISGMQAEIDTRNKQIADLQAQLAAKPVTPTPETITPTPTPTPDSVVITKDSLWARFIKWFNS